MTLPFFTYWCGADNDSLDDGTNASSRDRTAATQGPTDHELIERISHDNSLAFETLFVRYAASLATFAYRFAESRDGAHDVVHDVFARIWQNRKRLHIQGSVRSYLYAAAKNRALHDIEHRSVEARAAEVFLREEERPGMSASVATLGESPDTAMLRAETATAIRAAFAEVPPRARLIAVLRWQDGLGRAEIGDILGISVGTVNKQLTLAARALRERLKSFRTDGPESRRDG